MIRPILVTVLVLSLCGEAAAVDLLLPGGDAQSPIPGTRSADGRTFKPCTGPTRTIVAGDRFDTVNLSCSAYNGREARMKKKAESKNTRPPS